MGVLGRPTAGSRQCCTRLTQSGHGVTGLSIERPGLHDAFVKIVGAEALAASRSGGRVMAAGSLRRSIRQALTVARRDFIATVFTPTFLIFLLSPLLTIAFGAAGGLGASTMAQSAIDRSKLVVLAAPDRTAAMQAADTQLRDVFDRGDAPPPIEFRTPERDPEAQARTPDRQPRGRCRCRALRPARRAAHPLRQPRAERGELSRRARRPGAARRPDRIERAAQQAGQGRTSRKPRSPSSGHSTAAMFAVIAIFMLTLFLAGLTIGTMAEERNNKVIEVLAAAVPLESVFVGKLIGMFGVALLFVGFWGTVVSQITSTAAGRDWRPG